MHYLTPYTNTHLLVVWARSSDPDRDIAIAKLLRILLEGSNNTREGGRHVGKVCNPSTNDKHLLARQKGDNTHRVFVYLFTTTVVIR